MPPSKRTKDSSSFLSDNSDINRNRSRTEHYDYRDHHSGQHSQDKDQDDSRDKDQDDTKEYSGEVCVKSTFLHVKDPNRDKIEQLRRRSWAHVERRANGSISVSVPGTAVVELVESKEEGFTREFVTAVSRVGMISAVFISIILVNYLHHVL